MDAKFIQNSHEGISNKWTVAAHSELNTAALISIGFRVCGSTRNSIETCVWIIPNSVFLLEPMIEHLRGLRRTPFLTSRDVALINCCSPNWLLSRDIGWIIHLFGKLLKISIWIQSLVGTSFFLNVVMDIVIFQSYMKKLANITYFIKYFIIIICSVFNSLISSSRLWYWVDGLKFVRFVGLYIVFREYCPSKSHPNRFPEYRFEILHISILSDN